jgi:hypothetical protein
LVLSCDISVAPWVLIFLDNRGEPKVSKLKYR